MKPKQKATEIFNKVSRYNYLDSIDISKYVTREIINGINKAFDKYEENTKIYVKNRIYYYDYYEDVNLELLKKSINDVKEKINLK